ncbi:MAG: hypothetical protein AAF585_01700 [Verrucomicrobiota bacterium]
MAGKKSLRIVLGLVLISAAAVIGVIAFIKAPRGLHSSPTDLRERAHQQTWEPLMNPPSPSPSSRPFTQPSLKFTDKGSKIEVELKAASATAPVNHLITVVDEGESVAATIPGGPTIELLGLGAFWPSAPEEEADRYSGRAEIDIVHPITHEKLAPEVRQKLAKFSIDRPMHYYNTDVRSRYVVGSDRTENLRWLGIYALNDLTHSRMNWSWSISNRSELTTMNIGASAWHNPPLAIVIDFAWGDPIVKPVSIDPNAPPTAFPDFDVKVQHTRPGRWEMQSESSDGVTTVGVYEQNTRIDGDAHFGVLTMVPSDFLSRCYIDVGDGENHFLNSSSSMGVWNADQQLPESGFVNIKFLPNYGRVVFHIPSLPGGVNDATKMTNLFETQVPYVKFRQEYSIREFIERGVELEFDTPRIPGKPRMNFPLSYENVTVQEILDDYRDRTNQRTPIRVNEKRQTIEERESILDQFRNWWPF